ncbi:poly(ethylene terephthalate) hydrolase family protein [Streptomyces avermitilis]
MEPSGREKAYVELRNGDHLAPASESPTVGKYALSWLKRFVDDDTRYDQWGPAHPPVGLPPARPRPAPACKVSSRDRPRGGTVCWQA